MILRSALAKAKQGLVSAGFIVAVVSSNDISLDRLEILYQAYL
jgi:hypothetical protein